MVSLEKLSGLEVLTEIPRSHFYRVDLAKKNWWKYPTRKLIDIFNFSFHR